MVSQKRSPYYLVWHAASYYLKTEKESIWFIFAYTVLIGVFTVTASIIIQFVVNEISFTGQVYPLVLLTIILMASLTFASIFQLVRRLLIELLERRVLVRVAWLSLNNLTHRPLDFSNPDRFSVVHRFFDVFNYQKNLTHLIMDGAGTLIFIMITLIVVVFYHPVLFFFAALVILAFLLAIHFFIQLALDTNYAQSSQKYEMASWLTQLAETRPLYYQNRLKDLVTQWIDEKTTQYLKARKAHFDILLRQQGSLYLVEVLGAAFFLSVGGGLVLTGQMQMGQLVAAESLLVALLYNIGSFWKSLDATYDMVTSFLKLQYLTEEETFSRVQKTPVLSLPLKPFQQLQIASLTNRSRIYQISFNVPTILIFDHLQDRIDFLNSLYSTTPSSRWDYRLDETPIYMVSQEWRQNHIQVFDRLYLLSEHQVQEMANLRIKEKIRDGSLEEMTRQIKSRWLDSKDESENYQNLKKLLTQIFFNDPNQIIVIDHLFGKLSAEDQKTFLDLCQRFVQDSFIFILEDLILTSVTSVRILRIEA